MHSGFPWIAVLTLFLTTGQVIAAPNLADDTSRPIAPGEAGVRPFWNGYARRFIYAPAFDLPLIDGATAYRFTLTGADSKSRVFTADKPTAALSRVWGDLPEGLTTLAVDGLDAAGKVVGSAGERTFYRSPGFSGVAADPPRPYSDAARDALRAIYVKPHVQHWLVNGTHDRTYSLNHFPNKVMGGLIRAMAAYSRVADDPNERKSAIEIGRRAADHLLSLRTPADVRYAHLPPTYSLDVDEPYKGSRDRVPKRWFMVPSAIDAALGFLDLYDVTQDAKYLDAARAIADTFVKTQESDGTWPLMIDWKTAEPVAPQRLVPTWVISFFDRLENQYKLAGYHAARQRAWGWIEQNPLKTYQWDGQFEDVKLLEPYQNLSREQACDVAVMLLSEPNVSSERVAQADDLLHFAEDQFVIWAPVKDAAGFHTATKRTRVANIFITPCVLEQFNCYAPVARSSAVLINAYLKAYAATKKPAYLAKARALANGLLAGQAWAAREKDAGGEIPTWVMTDRYHNWLNNSFYAAEAVRNVADAELAIDRSAKRD